MKVSPSKLRLVSFSAALLASHLGAVACQVPVFRYALDRWPADTFRLEASAEALSAGPVAGALRDDAGVVNLEAVPRDAANPSPNAALFFPPISGEAAALWSGELNAASYRALIESPARAEIAKRLLAGESAIWLLVESGADEALATRLGEQIAMVEKTAELPVIDPEDHASRIGPGPKLQIRMSLLRVRRGAAEEQALIAMLAGPEGRAILATREPFAALVFGRGRVLGAWPKAELTDRHITEASHFLLGACSCEVKELVPGWDLLMRVNWDDELGKVAQARIAAGDVSPNSATSVLPETVTIQPATAVAPPQVRAGDTAAKVALAACIALLAGALAFQYWRRA